MSSPFDYMFSADLFVESCDAQLGVLVDKLGFHRPGPRSVAETPEAKAIICRVQKDVNDAPTRLEIIERVETDRHWNAKHLRDLWLGQRHRPMRFHSMNYVADLDVVADGLAARGVPYIVDETISFPRLWPGIHLDDPTHYDPRYDGGLRLEVLPFAAFPINVAGRSRSDAASDGAMRRIVQRSFLVDDLATVLSALETYIGWESEREIELVRSGSYQRALLRTRMDGGADLELIEALDESSHAGRYRAAWGSGPYYISIGVDGLDAKAAELDHRQVRYSRHEPTNTYPARISVAAHELDGALIDFWSTS